MFTRSRLQILQRCASCQTQRLAPQGGTTLSGDFAVGVQKLIALGFNTVKLPFSFNILTTAQPANVTSACSAANATALQVASLSLLGWITSYLSNGNVSAYAYPAALRTQALPATCASRP